MIETAWELNLDHTHAFDKSRHELEFVGPLPRVERSSCVSLGHDGRHGIESCQALADRRQQASVVALQQVKSLQRKSFVWPIRILRETREKRFIPSGGLSLYLPRSNVQGPNGAGFKKDARHTWLNDESVRCFVQRSNVVRQKAVSALHERGRWSSIFLLPQLQ